MNKAKVIVPCAKLRLLHARATERWRDNASNSEGEDTADAKPGAVFEHFSYINNFDTHDNLRRRNYHNPHFTDESKPSR